MSNIGQRGKATAEVVGGTIQQTLGHLLGDKEMEAKGAANKLVGHARDDVAKAAERIQGKVEAIAGAAKVVAGEILNDPATQVEGKIEELTGKARVALNKK